MTDIWLSSPALVNKIQRNRDTGDGSPRKHRHCRAHYVFTYFYCLSSVSRQ